MIEEIDEIFVKAKSVPEVVDNVEHVIASLPVTVKLIEADDEVAAERANVTVGAVVSGNVVVVVVVELVVVVVAVGTAVVVVVVGTGVVVVVVVAVDTAVVVVVVVVVGTAVVVVEELVVEELVELSVGSANHFTEVFSHQHLPVTGQRNTPVSLSAQANISLLLRDRKNWVPLIGHVLTYATVNSRLLVLIQNFGGLPFVNHTNLYSAPKMHLLSMLFLNVESLLLTQTEINCGCFTLLCDADATPLTSPNISPIATKKVKQRRKNNTNQRYKLPQIV